MKKLCDIVRTGFGYETFNGDPGVFSRGGNRFARGEWFLTPESCGRHFGPWKFCFNYLREFCDRSHSDSLDFNGAFC